MLSVQSKRIRINNSYICGTKMYLREPKLCTCNSVVSVRIKVMSAQSKGAICTNQSVDISNVYKSRIFRHVR